MNTKGCKSQSSCSTAIAIFLATINLTICCANRMLAVSSFSSPTVCGPYTPQLMVETDENVVQFFDMVQFFSTDQ